MKGRYWNIPPDYDGEKSDADFDYTWEYVVYPQEFFQQAAQGNLWAEETSACPIERSLKLERKKV